MTQTHSLVLVLLMSFVGRVAAQNSILTGSTHPPRNGNTASDGTTALPAAGKAKFTNLGTLGGCCSWAQAINNSGQVVGYSYPAGGGIYYHAFLYSGGTMIDLGAPGGFLSDSGSINDAGQVAGWYTTGGGGAGQEDFNYQRAFLYSGGIMTDIGTLGGSNAAVYQNGINNSGQIAGYSYTAGNAATHAFIYYQGTMTDLGTLGGTNSYASGINSSGQVVGNSQTAGDAATHAFIYSGGVMHDIGTLGGTNSYAVGINDSGQVLGTSQTAGDAATDVFVYSGPGSMHDIGTLGGNWTAANGINSRGAVAGASDTAGGAEHAFLYNRGLMTDLNSFLPANSRWVLTAAVINDSFQIAGFGFLNGSQTAFVLNLGYLEPWY